MSTVGDAVAVGGVADVVRLLELKAYRIARALPPITLEDVALVCWMAVGNQAASAR